MNDTLTQRKPEPAFAPGDYLVEFQRIGRHHGVPPLSTRAETGPDLASAIHDYARKYCGSSDLDVDVNYDGTGYVSAGMRNAGDFIWARAETAPTPTAPKES